MAALGPQVPDTAIDFSRYFVPETFTPLFYTPFYAALSEAQRLRYNQLHGCYCNEQIMFFERFIGENVLPRLQRDRTAASLAPRLGDFLEEERRHTRMFYELNRRCLPEVYAAGPFYFVQVPRGLKLAVDGLAKRPWLMPLLIWLMLLQEERAMYLGREIVRRRDDLEPHFVALQKIHLADETRHVQWDQELIALTWNKASSLKRKFLARLFTRIAREFLVTPKRGNLAVVAQWVREFPKLRPRWPAMRRALPALALQSDWNLSLYSRAITPKSFALFDRWPEFADVSSALLGYRPGEGSHE